MFNMLKLTQSVRGTSPPRRASSNCSKFPNTGSPAGPGGIAHLFEKADHFKSIGLKNWTSAAQLLHKTRKRLR